MRVQMCKDELRRKFQCQVIRTSVTKLEKRLSLVSMKIVKKFVFFRYGELDGETYREKLEDVLEKSPDYSYVHRVSEIIRGIS